MKNNVVNLEEVRKLNKMNILMRLLDEILTEGQATPQTWEEWQEVRKNEN